ncbi:MAG: T9SS type A sorting domain-containing protein [Bacteroidales bacterium]|nr:T9SS type A sorting domain-containing protein [Bacteroidales bacterium]MCF8456682.1 T9SS type A sorting domain-containing protein [Bacteroidales bacterium]
MMNADNLIGEKQVSQTIIVPRPNHPFRYYVFTPGYFVGPAQSAEFRYTEIDMEMDNGLGAALNYPHNTAIYSSATDKVTAVSHKNGLDIWVMCHEFNSNAFRAYLLTEDGLNLSSVISNCGSSITNPVPAPTAWDGVSVGEMKFSTDGKRIAYASKGLNLVEVFDFNNETGIVSNPISIPIPHPFYIEFSPDGTLLYIGQDAPHDSLNTWTESVHQIDLLAGSIQNIINSMIDIIVLSPNMLPTDWLPIQLGLDNKIYVGFNPHISTYPPWPISVLNYPNSPGLSCDFEYDVISFPPNEVNGVYHKWIMSFPNFYRSYLESNIVANNVCIGETTVIYTKTNTNFDSIRWEFSDPVIGQVSIANTDSINFTFSTPGEYDIHLKRYRNNQLDEVIKQVEVAPYISANFGSDTLLCPGEQITISASMAGVTPEWHNLYGIVGYGDTFIVETPGTYWVEAQDINTTCGESVDSISVEFENVEINMFDTMSGYCTGSSVHIYSLAFGVDSYAWSTGATGFSITTYDSGWYYLTVTKNSCTLNDSILVIIDEPMNIDLGPDTTFCNVDSVQLDIGSFTGLADIVWLPTSETTPQIWAQQSGQYTVEATNACGVYYDSIVISLLNTPFANFPPDSSFCVGDSLQIDVSNQGSNYLWSTGNTTQAVWVSSSGLYSVTINNACGQLNFQISVSVDSPLVSNLNIDTVLCPGESLVFSPGFDALYQWSDGSTDNSMVVDEGGVYFVTITNTCNSIVDNIVVTESATNNVFAFDTLFLVAGSSISVSPGPGFQTYIWSTGSTDSSIVITQTGQYSVTVSDAFNCTGSDGFIVVPKISIDIIPTDEGFYIYPNPANDKFYIVSSEILNLVEIYNQTGQLLQIINTNTNQETIDVSGFATGHYFIRVITQEEVFVRKFVVVRL